MLASFRLHLDLPVFYVLTTLVFAFLILFLPVHLYSVAFYLPCACAILTGPLV
jgi:hypothetical protein